MSWETLVFRPIRHDLYEVSIWGKRARMNVRRIISMICSGRRRIAVAAAVMRARISAMARTVLFHISFNRTNTRMDVKSAARMFAVNWLGLWKRIENASQEE